MIFELKKPLYEWYNYAPPGVPADNDLRLRPDIEQWLASQGIKYDAYSLQEKRDLGKGDGEQTYLIFYIDVWDNQEAMLFKLTWM